ncbi:hypothetical protein ACVW1B_008582 [Bradyrhizobium sp. USDA 4502]
MIADPRDVTPTHDVDREGGRPHKAENFGYRVGRFSGVYEKMNSPVT